MSLQDWRCTLELPDAPPLSVYIEADCLFNEQNAPYAIIYEIYAQSALEGVDEEALAEDIAAAAASLLGLVSHTDSGWLSDLPGLRFCVFLGSSTIWLNTGD